MCILVCMSIYVLMVNINVGIMLIALINIDPLVFQFDSINLFQKGHIFM